MIEDRERQRDKETERDKLYALCYLHPPHIYLTQIICNKARSYRERQRDTRRDRERQGETERDIERQRESKRDR